MTQAENLLDSRSFRNKLDAFISIAARKRPLPTDKDLAEYLQPVLDAAQGASVAPTPQVAPLPASEVAIPAVVKPIEVVLKELIDSLLPDVQRAPVDMKGLRWINVGMEVPVAELTGFSNSFEDTPWFVDPQEMTMMNPERGGWVLPCRLR